MIVIITIIIINNNIMRVGKTKNKNYTRDRVTNNNITYYNAIGSVVWYLHAFFFFLKFVRYN